MEKPIPFDRRKRRFRILPVVLFVLFLLIVSSGKILTALGQWLILDQEPVHADAVVVLNTGPDWYPRVMEAAELYKGGLADQVVINGNRKTPALRKLEQMGYEACCPWYEGGFRILALLGVPREAVLAVSAEDAYDTVSEAKAVGQFLVGKGVKTVIITTSKYHTKRSHHIWQKSFSGRLRVQTVAAKQDPFSPKEWWKHGAQVRSVMAEYGAWIYYYWKRWARIEK